jgi:GNAT superfamily N-acetyltransferase
VDSPGRQDLRVPVVRAARLDDLDAIVEVHLAAFRAGNGPCLSPDALAELTPERDRAAWESVLREPPEGARVMVGERAGRIVGVAGAGPARDPDLQLPAGELYALYVDPPSWGGGHGSALHDGAIRHLAEEGFDQGILWVLQGNTRARRFYESRGWADEGGRGEFRGAQKMRLRRSI